MNQQDPWAYIRWSRRVMIGLPFLFILGLLARFLIFPQVPVEVVFEKWGISLVILGWIFVLLPTSCPRCHHCYVLWNLPNWGHWFGIQFRHLFNPIGSFVAVFNSPCPHCGLEYQSDPGDPNQAQTP